MNEERDRFGEFIRLLERAREDVFFAEKDRDLLDKLKRRLEKAQQGQWENSAMKCPRCGISLHNSRVSDLPVSRCSACGGIWLDRGAMPEFIKLSQPGSAEKRESSSSSLRSVWPEGIQAIGDGRAVSQRLP
jgi:Zn-finger nucleic acid-binding protein